MSVVNLDSQSGSGLSITSEATVATYTAAADGWVSLRLLLSNLNGAAAVITVKVQLLDASNNKLGVPVSFSNAKDAAADTTFAATMGPIRVTSGQKLRIRAASSNSSDSNASWATVMDDADVPSTVKTKTDFLPSITAGAAGGVLIAGSNAATTFATFTITGTTALGPVTITNGGGIGLSINGSTAGALIAGGSAGGLALSGDTGDMTLVGTGTIINGDDGGVVLKANTMQLNGQNVTAAAGVTFPSSIASPTNITAGTLTNLTNAPTNGDFTATMKTSLNAATPSVSVSDKSGFTLAGTQTFNNTGTWTGNISGTVSTVDTLTGHTPQTGDAFTRLGAPAGASIAADVAAVLAAVGAIGSVGDGSVAVNHDTGGDDALRVMSDGAGVDGCVIRAYLTSEYDAGGRTVRGQTTTNVTGRWSQDLMLDPGDYTLTFHAPGYVLENAEVTLAD